MRIRLDELESEPLIWEESLAIPVAELNRDDLVELGPVECAGRLEREEAGFRLRMRLAYDQTLACVRCLGPLEQRVEVEAELAVRVGGPQPTLGDYDLQAEDLDLLELDEEILETRPIVMEQIQLNVPMRALCREDCAGLCPVCGANRNERSCDCDQPATDPRWEILKTWRGDPS